MELVREQEIKRLNKVFLIDEEGKNLGEMEGKEVIDLSNERELDVVVLHRGEVLKCKLMDYSKFKYEQKKKERKAKKNSVVIKTKEVKLSFNIGEHDLQVKAKNARRMLDKGNRVKVVLYLKGREITFKNLGKDLMYKFKDLCGSVEVYSDIKLEGKRLTMVLVNTK